MSHELVYTSVPRGLRPGEHGFCTVAATRGLPPSLAARLEALSAYRHLFNPPDRRAALNPVAYSHLRLQVDGQTYHVVSRIADAGLDYSQRTNKLAHHIAFERSELPPGGPAWLLTQPQLMTTMWGDQAPQLLTTGRGLPAGEPTFGRCANWQEITGDAGWGGALASSISTSRPAYLVFEPGIDPLPLIAESLALLPPEQRWNVTFSTYFMGFPADVACQWRCVVAGSPEEAQAERSGGLVIRLEPTRTTPSAGPLVEAARTGRRPPREIESEPRTPVRAAASHDSSSGYHARPTAAVASPPISAPAAFEALPIMLEPPARSFSSVLVLMLGLLVGLVLMALCLLPIELITGRSMPRLAGVVGSEEESANRERVTLEGRVATLDRELAEEKRNASDLRRLVEEKPRPTPPAVEIRIDESALAALRIQAANELKEQAAKYQEQIDGLKGEIAALKKPMTPMAPKSGVAVVDPAAMKREDPANVVSIPKPDAGKAVVIKLTDQIAKKVAKLELVGMPSKLNQQEVKVAATAEGGVEVLIGGQPFVAITRDQSDQWNLEIQPIKDADGEALEALRGCVLSVDGGAFIAFRSQAIASKLKLSGGEATMELPFAEVPATGPGSLRFGKDAAVQVGDRTVNLLERENLSMAGNVPANPKYDVEMLLDGSTLTVRRNPGKLTAAPRVKVSLYRQVGDRLVKIADIGK